jgi:hypothetical protein
VGIAPGITSGSFTRSGCALHRVGRRRRRLEHPAHARAPTGVRLDDTAGDQGDGRRTVQQHAAHEVRRVTSAATVSIQETNA